MPGEYEISWEWVEGNQIWAEDNVVVKLDTNITTDLYEEGIAREISRFLNQMRKEAGYDISDRILLFFEGDPRLEEIVLNYNNFLSSEALLKDLKKGVPQDFDIHNIFKSESGEDINFYLKK